MTDPFDPTTDEDSLLAVSAVLDGTASVEDAARVEADPALRALVDDLRALRTEVADVPAAPAASREAAIASALAAFDDLHASTATEPVPTQPDPRPAAAPTSGTVVRFERRRRWYGVLTGAAAAAVAVLFVGALVSGGLGGDDEDQSTAFEAPAAEPGARTAPGDTVAGMTEAAPAAGAETMTEMAAEDAAGSVAGDAATEATGAGGAGGADIEMSDETAATDAPAAPAATAAATEATTDGDGTIDSIDGAAEVVAITSPEQLRDYARGRRAVLPLPGLGLPCVDEGMEALGEVTYQGVQSIVVRDPSTGTVTAYDLRGSCAVVATAAP